MFIGGGGAMGLCEACYTSGVAMGAADPADWFRLDDAEPEDAAGDAHEEEVLADVEQHERDSFDAQRDESQWAADDYEA